MSDLDNTLMGRQIDEYRIDRPLGAGGMARVYRALDIRLKRYVALKVIAPDFRMDSEYSMRFEREAQSIARLEHPNIVRIYRFGEVNGLYYMAMQYIDGADVDFLIQDYRSDGEVMPLDEVKRITAQIGAALDYAHSKGVIHRDIKPGNLMVDKTGTAFLTDFGLVFTTDTGTMGEIFGSPHYIAPEQAISSKNVVPQSDLYALGVSIYEMLTGEVPFATGDPMDIARRHISDPPPPPSAYKPEIPGYIDEVILRMLEKEPGDRYATGAELSAALSSVLDRWQGEKGQGEKSSKPLPGSRRPSMIMLPQKVDSIAPPLPEFPPDLPPAPPPDLSSLARTQPNMLPDLPPMPAGVDIPANVTPPTQPTVRPVDLTPGFASNRVPTTPSPAAPEYKIPDSPIYETQATPWQRSFRAPILVGVSIFVVGLFALLLAFAAFRGNNAISTLPTRTPLIPIASETSTVTSTSTQTLVPTPTSIFAQTQVLFPTAIPPTVATVIILPTSTTFQQPPLATWTPVILPTNPPPPTPIPPTSTSVPPTSIPEPTIFILPTETPIVIGELPPTVVTGELANVNNLRVESDKNWFALVNVASVPVVIKDLVELQARKDDREFTLNPTNWNLSVLEPGACLRIYKEKDPPNDLPPGCITAYSIGGDKDYDVWFKETFEIRIGGSTFEYKVEKKGDD